VTAPDPLLLERAARVRLLALDVDGVLTDGKLYFDNSGNEIKTFSTRDGFGLRSLQRFGISLAFITGRRSDIVSERARQLGVEHVYQGQDNKMEAFRDLLEKTGCAEKEICYAGDDLIDLPILLRAGLSVTVSDAVPQVKDHVHWVTGNPGGSGAVREICDLILQARGLDQQLLEEYLAQ
jgi:3-deoxy-D-manno-octulosonate 8-phosphate phosphatase (KDO 8-P phosphatase)